MLPAIIVKKTFMDSSKQECQKHVAFVAVTFHVAGIESTSDIYILHFVVDMMY